MYTVTLEEVKEIASLARLELTDAELQLYQANLSAVLTYVEKLAELDLDGVPRTTHAVAQQNILREDKVNSSLPVNEALANTAAQAQDQFAIQAVLEE